MPAIRLSTGEINRYIHYAVTRVIAVWRKVKYFHSESPGTFVRANQKAEMLLLPYPARFIK